MNTNKAILYKVKPIAEKIPDPAGDWDLPNSDSKFYSPNRKVLKVRFAFPPRNKKDQTPQSSTKDYFYIDVPKHFFAQETNGNEVKLGDFIANPLYSEHDVLVVRWTGYGKYSGWIDTNVQMRGAGIGTVIEQGGVACAKWS